MQFDIYVSGETLNKYPGNVTGIKAVLI